MVACADDDLSVKLFSAFLLILFTAHTDGVFFGLPLFLVSTSETWKPPRHKVHVFKAVIAMQIRSSQPLRGPEPRSLP